VWRRLGAGRSGEPTRLPDIQKYDRQDGSTD
jgi:hypothetical protein